MERTNSKTYSTFAGQFDLSKPFVPALRTLWKANIPVPPELQKPGKALTLMVKAVDANYNVQPESIELLRSREGVDRERGTDDGTCFCCSPTAVPLFLSFFIPFFSRLFCIRI